MQKLPVMLYYIKQCCSNVIGPPGHHVVTRSHSTSVVTVSHTCPMSGYSSAASGNITAPLPAHGPTLIILHTPAAHCIKHLPAGLLHHAANTIKYFSNDNKHLVAGTRDPATVYIWHIATERPILQTGLWCQLHGTESVSFTTGSFIFR